MIVNAFVALGSNLDQPQNQLIDALASLDALDAVHVRKRSSFYRSKPVGPQDQPDYINAVAGVETSLPALELLDRMQEIEDRQGRVRDGTRWGPRTLDLDLLLYGEEQINNKRLTVPHPEMQNRDFVLIPLQEIAPDMFVPGLGPLSGLVNRIERHVLERLA